LINTYQTYLRTMEGQIMAAQDGDYEAQKRFRELAGKDGVWFPREHMTTWGDKLKFGLLCLLAVGSVLLGATACNSDTGTDTSVTAAPTATAQPTHKATQPPTTPPGDVTKPCDSVPVDLQSECMDAMSVPAYSWRDQDGSEVTDPGGRADVLDTLADPTLTHAELKAQFQGIIQGYMDHPGHVMVDLNKLPVGDCWYEVKRDGSVEPLCNPSHA
jgi:hypothetical protein